MVHRPIDGTKNMTSLEERLLALSPENFQKVKTLRERCLDLIAKAARLKGVNARKCHDNILATIDKIEADRLMVEAHRLDQQITELLA
jgi:hypothetical protein